MMNKKICVVGAGHWGKNHINTLHSLGCLKGVVDPRQKELDYSLSRYSQINTYTSLEYSLKDNYDGYIVATPAGTHYKIAKRLLHRVSHC